MKASLKWQNTSNHYFSGYFDIYILQSGKIILKMNGKNISYFPSIKNAKNAAQKLHDVVMLSVGRNLHKNHIKYLSK